MKFRAFFNETEAAAEACEQQVRDAVSNAAGLRLASDLRTIASDNGVLQNVTVDFVVDVDETADSRSPKGRLNEFLMGDNACTGLIEMDQ